LTAELSANVFARVHDAENQSSGFSPSARAVRDCNGSEKFDLLFGRPELQAKCSYYLRRKTDHIAELRKFRKMKKVAIKASR